MPEIAFHTNAAEEMRAAAAYYQARERGLGDHFLDEVEEGLQRIRQFPRLWPICEGEYRRRRCRMPSVIHQTLRCARPQKADVAKGAPLEVATLLLLQVLLAVKIAKSLVFFRGRRCLDSLS
jgi:hypothetical protein